MIPNHQTGYPEKERGLHQESVQVRWFLSFATSQIKYHLHHVRVLEAPENNAEPFPHFFSELTQ